MGWYACECRESLDVHRHRQAISRDAMVGDSIHHPGFWGQLADGSILPFILVEESNRVISVRFRIHEFVITYALAYTYES